MIDCPNGDVRDLLPDYLHDRLESSARMSVERHLAGCAACRDELALLRDLRGTLRRAPRIDVAAVAAAIPPYQARVRKGWTGGWRVAAAIAAIVVGGASLTLVNRKHAIVANPERVAATPPIESIRSAPTTGTASPETGLPTREIIRATPQPSRRDAAPLQSAEPVSLAMTGQSLGDLSDGELSSLLDEIETLDGVPSTDVEGAGALTTSFPLEHSR
jgi:ribosome modulation factor